MARHGIKIDYDYFNSDHWLFKNFMQRNPKGFLSFKGNSDISRTLVQNRLKPKLKTGIEKRMEEVVRIHAMMQQNKKEIRRLEKELECLFPINKMLYHEGVRDLNRVIEHQKAGHKPEKIKYELAMLNHETSTYLPDGKDYLLANLEQNEQKER